MNEDEITQEETSTPEIETEPESETETTVVKAEIAPVTEPEPVEVVAEAEMMSPVEELLPPINIYEFDTTLKFSIPDFSAFPG